MLDFKTEVAEHFIGSAFGGLVVQHIFFSTEQILNYMVVLILQFNLINNALLKI